MSDDPSQIWYGLVELQMDGGNSYMVNLTSAPSLTSGRLLPVYEKLTRAIGIRLGTPDPVNVTGISISFWANSAGTGSNGPVDVYISDLTAQLPVTYQW